MNTKERFVMSYNKDLLMLSFMWLTGFLRLQYLNENIKTVIQIGCCVICGLYVLANIGRVLKSTMIPVFLYSLISLISSMLNYRYHMRQLLGAIIYAVLVFEFYAVIKIVSEKQSFDEIIGCLLKTTMIYWIPAIISVFLVGYGDHAGEGVYFIGNKFSIAYLNVIIICFLAIVCKKRNYQQINIFRRYRLVFWIFSFFSLLLDIYMVAFTGLLMTCLLLILIVLDNYFTLRKGQKLEVGIVSALRKPIVIIFLIIISGVIVLVLEEIIQIPSVYTYLESINKTITMTARLKIYSFLSLIIKQHPFLGYGYGSTIMMSYYGVNPQNGFMRIVIFSGILGAVAFLLMIYVNIRTKNRITSADSDILLYGIYAFILSSVVEISYGNQFFILTALYAALLKENTARKNKFSSTTLG